MAKRTVWIGARGAGVTRWIDARADSRGNNGIDDVRTTVGRGLARHGIDAFASWLASATIVATSKKAQRALDERLTQGQWDLAQPLVATFDAATAPAAAALVDANARCVHLYRSGVVDHPAVAAFAPGEIDDGKAIHAALTRVAVVPADDGARAEALLRALSDEGRHVGELQDAAWESAYLAALADPIEKARLDLPWVEHLITPPAKTPKAAHSVVDAIIASRAAWARKRGPAAFVLEADEATLRRIAAHFANSAAVAERIAERTAPSPAEAWRVVERHIQREDVQIEVAKSPHAPLELLQRVYAIGSDRVKDALVEKNPAAPASIFEELLRDSDVMRAVRAARWSPSPARAILAQHRDAAVRGMLAEKR